MYFQRPQTVKKKFHAINSLRLLPAHFPSFIFSTCWFLPSPQTQLEPVYRLENLAQEFVLI